MSGAAGPRVGPRSPDGPVGQQAQPHTGEAEATPVTAAPTTQVAAIAATRKRRTTDRRSAGTVGLSFMRLSSVLVAGALRSGDLRIGVRLSAPAGGPAPGDAGACRSGACALAAQAAEALRQGPASVAEAGPVLARELVGHVRSALALDVDCYEALCDAGSPVVAVLRSEAASANPPWGHALVDGLAPAVQCLGRTGRAVARLRAGGRAAEAVRLLAEAEGLWLEAHGGRRAAPAAWDAVRAAAAEGDLGPGERVDAVAAALGGPVGMLAGLLAGRPPSRPDVQLGLPLVEHRVAPEGELAVFELRAVPGSGQAFPSPQMILTPTDAGFRAAIAAAALAVGLPSHLDVAWTVRTDGRVLLGESVGAAAAVGMEAVRRGIRVIRPDVAVAGGIAADGVLRSLVGESMPVYAAKLSVCRRAVVPAVDRSALRSEGLVTSGTRVARTARQALRVVRRERWRMPALTLGGAVAVGALLAGAPTGATGGEDRPAPTVAAPPAVTVAPGSGSISGAVQVRVASPRAMTVAGDTIAATDGSRLTLSDLAGESVRTFQLPFAPVLALGHDGSAYWAVAGGEIHRFAIAGERPAEWIRPLGTSRWPLTGVGSRDSAHDGAGLWVVDGFDVVRIDVGGTVTARLRAAGKVSGVAFADGALWLAEESGPFTTRLRQVAPDGTELRTLPTELKSAAALDWRDGELWVAVDSVTRDRSWVLLRMRP